MRMTDNKRLIVDEYYNWVDTETDSIIEIEDAFDLVNELADENEELKSDNKGLSNEILEISNLIADIAEEDLTESQRTLINRICKVVFK